MEKLLALKGIKSISYIENEIIYKFFYTDHFLANNIFIEYYENEYEGDDNATRYETNISACHSFQNNCYVFKILFDNRLVVPPLYPYRIILDLVEIIENSDRLSLIANLEHAATSILSSASFRREEKAQIDFDRMVTQKISKILELINQSKIEGN